MDGVGHLGMLDTRRVITGAPPGYFSQRLMVAPALDPIAGAIRIPLVRCAKIRSQAFQRIAERALSSARLPTDNVSYLSKRRNPWRAHQPQCSPCPDLDETPAS